ncbi:hypothetical protein LINPERPRIM_LOCUS33554 [Linum perenne]
MLPLNRSSVLFTKLARLHLLGTTNNNNSNSSSTSDFSAIS